MGEVTMGQGTNGTKAANKKGGPREEGAPKS